MAVISIVLHNIDSSKTLQCVLLKIVLHVVYIKEVFLLPASYSMLRINAFLMVVLTARTGAAPPSQNILINGMLDF